MMLLPRKVAEKILPLTECDCWLWTATLNGWGYGVFKAGKTRLAHRYVFECLAGPIPEGLVLDHKCKVTACVNPAHLEAVTQKENMERVDWAKRKPRAPLTHCRRGHEFTKQNEVWRKDGTRTCRACFDAGEVRRRVAG